MVVGPSLAVDAPFPFTVTPFVVSDIIVFLFFDGFESTVTAADGIAVVASTTGDGGRDAGAIVAVAAAVKSSSCTVLSRLSKYMLYK